MIKRKKLFILFFAFIVTLLVVVTSVTEGQVPEPWHPIDNPPPPELLNAPPPEKPAYVSQEEADKMREAEIERMRETGIDPNAEPIITDVQSLRTIQAGGKEIILPPNIVVSGIVISTVCILPCLPTPLYQLTEVGGEGSAFLSIKNGMIEMSRHIFLPNGEQEQIREHDRRIFQPIIEQLGEEKIWDVDSIMEQRSRSR